MKLEDYRIKSEKTFQEIADKLKIDKSTVFRIMRTPWRTSLLSFLQVSNYLGMAEFDARSEWLLSKKRYLRKKTDRKIEQLSNE